MSAARTAFAAAALVGVLSCGAPAGPPSPSSAQPRASSPAEASAAPVVIEPPKALRRATTPQQRREHDEAQCLGGDAKACREAADRYRGYGHVAGCGVARERPKPFRMVTAADAPGDRRRFDGWIRRACDLGDDDACAQ
ncbi:MAG TPA: hypothetical protein VHB21_13535, partial [Minicystis sp.]|nr:hypothetical protein [Minicystis sp.]